MVVEFPMGLLGFHLEYDYTYYLPRWLEIVKSLVEQMTGLNIA